MAEEVVKELIAKNSNRRNFVRNLGIASAAVGAAAVLDPSKAEAQAAYTDIDILNFALNLEYLEAEFYTYATTGVGIEQFGYTVTGGSGTAGATTGGARVNFTDSLTRNVALELAEDEQDHVALIQNTITQLGGQYVNRPALNLNALGFGFGNQADFLRLSRIFEDIGTSAYGGAANLLTNSAVVNAAARILAVEAEHVGAIRQLIAAQSIQTFPALDAADVLPPASGVKFFSTNSVSLTLTRTVGQVLYLAFGGTATTPPPVATSGGFFPAGVNGLAAFQTASNTAAGYDTAYMVGTPNPISANGGTYGQTTITWYAPPSVQYIQIRVGSPTGPLFTTNFPQGSMMTGQWVTDGMVLYLQDITNGKALNANNTIAKVILYVS